MTGNPEDWQNYPYLVEWVESANRWAREYEIYEFMPADDQGLDPSGQFSPTDYYPMVPKFTTQQTGRFDDEGSLVWTLVDSDERYVQSDFHIGGDDTIGWFLGRIPHYGKTFPVRYLNEVCITCEGQGSYFVPGSDEEVGCLVCEEDRVLVELEHTSSSTHQVSGQERNKAIGPKGILYFKIGSLLDPGLFEKSLERLKNL